VKQQGRITTHQTLQAALSAPQRKRASYCNTYSPNKKPSRSERIQACEARERLGWMLWWMASRAVLKGSYPPNDSINVDDEEVRKEVKEMDK